MADTSLKYTLSLKDLFSGKMDQMYASTKRLDSGMNKLDNTAKRIGGAIAGYFAVSKIVDFGKSVIDSLVNYEYFSASLRTLMHGDTQMAKALQVQLINLAKTTPFSLVQVQDVSKQLLAYGFKPGDLVKQINMLGDVSSATGNMIGDVAYLYGTLRTQGKAMTKDLYQFTNRGINILPQLAKQFGVAESAVYDLARQGKISFRDVEKAFITMTSKGGDFFEMMKTQSQTVGGQISNLGDSWEQLKIGIGRSQTGIVNGTVSWLNNMVSSIQKVVDATNRMDDAFAKAGIDGLNKWEHMLQTIATGMNESSRKAFLGKDMYQVNENDKFIQQDFVNPSAGNKLDAIRAKSDILNFMTSLSKDFINKNIDKNVYEKTYALAKQGLEAIIGNIKLFDAKANPGLDDGTAKTEEEAKATDISGNRPQNLYITINDGLVKNMTVSTTTLQESVPQIKEMMAKVFLEVVNDANDMAR